MATKLNSRLGPFPGSAAYRERARVGRGDYRTPPKKKAGTKAAGARKRGQRFEINPGGKTGGKGTGVNANTGGGG